MVQNPEVGRLPRPPHDGRWSPLQGFLGLLHRPAVAPRPEEIRTLDSRALQAPLPRQESL